MKREREEEMRTGRNGAPSIAFVDLANLSGAAGAAYVAAIIGFFVLVFYVLINKVFVKPVDFNKQRKVDRIQKKQSSTNNKKS